MKYRALLVALLGLSLSVPSAAMADTLTKDDPAGDVATVDESGMVVNPELTNGDIVRTVITHGPAQVKVRVTLVDLAKEGRILTYVSVKSNRGRSAYRSFEITAAPGAYQGKVRVQKASGKTVACRTTRKLDYAASTIQLAIPRGCIGSPRWVRVGVGVITTDRRVQSFGVDDARGNGTTGNNDPFFSTKIFR